MHDRMSDDDQKESSTRVDRSRDYSQNEGLSVGKLIRLGVVLGAAYVFVKQLPELQRYLKMRQM